MDLWMEWRLRNNSQGNGRWEMGDSPFMISKGRLSRNETSVMLKRMEAYGV